MKISELRGKTKEEMQEMLSRTREQLRGLRFKVANKEVKNFCELRTARKTIAQLLTLLK